jgi:hypothetical protein
MSDFPPPGERPPDPPPPTPPAPGWWRASDGTWYPPETAPGTRPPPPAHGTQPEYGPPPAYGGAGYGYTPYAAPARTNGLAIASLVLGIVWLEGLGSILALIFGYIALRQIKQRQQRGRGLAIAGVVLGWIGVALLALVIVLAVSTS